MLLPMKIRYIILTMVASMLLTSCSLAPTHLTPEVALEEAWVGTALEAQQKESALAAYSLGWRDYFQDPQLQQFIAEALEHNHDLRIAALNAELAQAQYRITHSEILPTVIGSASGERARTPRDISFAGMASTSTIYNVGLGLAAFELDFFNRVKNQSRAMLNSYLATLEARDAAQLSMVSAVAKAYYQMRINQKLMELAENVEKVRQESLELTQLQVEAGTAMESTLQGMISAIELARADYEERSRGWQQSRNLLSQLIGRPLSSLEIAPQKQLATQFPDEELLAGVPAEVLLFRPDIRQAEYALKAMNANIGVARAAYFPSISLTSSVGYGSDDLGDLFDGANFMWSLAPQVDLPLFDYGRRRANVEVMEARQKIAVEQYKKAVQSAFTDINNALVARKTLERQFDAIVKSDGAVAERLRIVKTQLREGIADGLMLLDAERESFFSQQGVVATELLILNNRVDLYIAMGGGLYEVVSETGVE